MRLVVRMHLAQLHAGVGEAVALELVFHCYPCTLLPDRGCGRCSLSALQRGRRRARRERARGGWRASSTCVVVERERVRCLYNATRGETTMRREGKLAVGGPKLAGWGSPATPIPQVSFYCPHPASLTGGVSRYAPNVRTQRTHLTYATNVRTQNSTLGKCPFPVYKTRIRKPSKSGTRTAHSASSSLITASASCA